VSVWKEKNRKITIKVLKFSTVLNIQIPFPLFFQKLTSSHYLKPVYIALKLCQESFSWNWKT